MSPRMIKYLSLFAEAMIAVLGALMARFSIDILRARRLLPHHQDSDDEYTESFGGTIPIPNARKKRRKKQQVGKVVDTVNEAVLDATAPIAADAILEPLEKKLDRKIAGKSQVPTNTYNKSQISQMLNDAMLKPKSSHKKGKSK